MKNPQRIEQNAYYNATFKIQTTFKATTNDSGNATSAPERARMLPKICERATQEDVMMFVKWKIR